MEEQLLILRMSDSHQILLKIDSKDSVSVKHEFHKVRKCINVFFCKNLTIFFKPIFSMGLGTWILSLPKLNAYNTVWIHCPWIHTLLHAPLRLLLTVCARLLPRGSRRAEPTGQWILTALYIYT